MANIQKKIQKARPKLSLVAPLTNMLVNIFIIFNLNIAYSLYLSRPNPGIVIIDGIFNTYFWVGVFLALAVGLFVSKRLNDWGLMQKILTIGLFVKSMFTIALFVLAYQYGFKNIYGTLIIWVTISLVQASVIAFFDPMTNRTDGHVD
jgi:hypothetical protein